MDDVIIEVDPDDPDNDNPAACVWFKTEQLANSPLRDELTAMLPKLLPMLETLPTGVAVKDVATMFTTDSPRRRVRRIRKDGVTAGMTAETGVEGVDLVGDDDEKDEKKAKDLAAKTLDLLRPEVERLLASANRVDAMRDMVMAIAAKSSDTRPPDVHVHLDSPPAPDVHVSSPITVEAAKAPDVYVSTPEVTVHPPDVKVNVEPAKVKVEAAPVPQVNVTVAAPEPEPQAGKTTARRMPDGSVVIERSDS